MHQQQSDFCQDGSNSYVTVSFFSQTVEFLQYFGTKVRRRRSDPHLSPNKQLARSLLSSNTVVLQLHNNKSDILRSFFFKITYIKLKCER